MSAAANILAEILSTVSWREKMQASAPLIGCAPAFLAKIAGKAAAFPFKARNSKASASSWTSRPCFGIPEPVDSVTAERMARIALRLGLKLRKALEPELKEAPRYNRWREIG